MTKDKDFKELVHARVAQTGEKYTAARERLIEEGTDQDREPRILGLENRYSAFAHVEGRGELSPEETVRYLFSRVVAYGRAMNVFLTNGARLYVAAEGVIEYATPECSSAREALTYARAGETVLGELARLTEARLAEEGTKASLELFVDRSPAGGSHESYGAPRSFPTQRIHEFLVPFLVTRQVFAGTGGMVDTPNGARFVLSPRAYEVSTDDSYSGRLVNGDAPPHADPERYRRIHIDVGDANRSDAAALLKVATTRLVLRAIEEEPESLSDLALDDPMGALRDVSLDPTCRTTLRLAAGSAQTALDVQALVLRGVRRHLSKTSATNEERRAIDQWQAAIDGLRSDPSSLADSVEWVERLRRLKAAGDNRAETVQLDRALDRIDVANAFSSHRVCSEAEIAKAGRAAPPSTRAAIRGRFLEACKASRRDHTVDWTHLKLNDEANRTVILKSPGPIDDERIEKFLAYIAHRPSES